MSDLSSLDTLYREILMDHHQDPRNFGSLNQPDISVEGFNPLCGDRVVLDLKLSGDRSKLEDFRFRGEGCSICMASASIMTELVLGSSLTRVRGEVEKIRAVMKGEQNLSSDDGDLEALAGVRRFPVRIKCALLPWTTLKDGLDQAEGKGKSDGTR